jgi:arylsulfatase A
MIHRRSFLATMASALATRLAAAPSKPPNIVFVLCDDLGYGDLGCYGSKIPTPNLDRMAAAGVRFTNFSSADPVCSPSRAALLTGRYPTRVGVPHVFFPQDKGGMNLDEVTLANVLKNNGYRTICIGKWHLGRPVEYLPTSRGFDEYFGIPYSNDMNPRVLMHNTEVIEQEVDLSTLTPRYTEQAIRFIRENRGSPMFLFLPQTYPHIPLGASERFRGKSPEGLYGDVVQEIDWSVGEIRRTLRENGLRGRKNTTYEGGVREPFLAVWPGKIPSNRVCDGLASMLDMFPTIARQCGAALPAKPLDGIDIWPLLTGRKASIDREALLYFDGWDLQCARWMNWKLHVARHNTAAYTPPPPEGRLNYSLARPELYNLASDPDESYDVAPQNPRIVAEIQRRIESLLPSFPEEVQKSWAEAQSRRSNPSVPAGAYPKPNF